MNFSDLPAVSPRKLNFIVRTAIAAGLAWAIPGPSGAGKSELIESIVQELDDQVKSGTPIKGHPDCDGAVLMTIMGPQYDEYTLRGVQTFLQDSTGKFITACADPSWKVQYDALRTANPNALIVIFIDEIGVASEPMQASILELLSKKRIDQHELSDPEKVVFLAAYNRREDGASFFNMSKPLARRFGGHTVIQPVVEDFLMWGYKSGKVAPEVDLFLSQYPDALIQDPEEDFANDISPRGWEYVSRVIETARLESGEVPIYQIGTMLGSRMTQQMLVQFQMSIELAGEMPRWTEVLLNPTEARLPKDIMVQALALRSFATQITDQRTADAYLLYVDRCSVEAIGAASSIVIALSEQKQSVNLGDLGFVFSAAESRMSDNSSTVVEERARACVAAAKGRFAQVAAVTQAQASDDAPESAAATAPAAPTEAPSTGAPKPEFDFDFSNLH